MAAQAQSGKGLVVVKDNLQLIYQRNEGIGVQYFRDLQDHTSMPKAELTHFVGVDPTTVDNYRKQNKIFTGDSAEKLLKLQRLFALGEELFGSTDKFTDWLHMPSTGLEGQNPVELLHSITGIGEIEKQLNLIIHGYVA